MTRGPYVRRVLPNGPPDHFLQKQKLTHADIKFKSSDIFLSHCLQSLLYGNSYRCSLLDDLLWRFMIINRHNRSTIDRNNWGITKEKYVFVTFHTCAMLQPRVATSWNFRWRQSDCNLLLYLSNKNFLGGTIARLACCSLHSLYNLSRDKAYFKYIRTVFSAGTILRYGRS